MTAKPRFDRVTFVKAEKRSGGSRCRVLAFRQGLTKAELASFNAALTDKSISVRAIYRVAKEHGYLGALTSIYNHRTSGGVCHQCRDADGRN